MSDIKSYEDFSLNEDLADDYDTSGASRSDVKTILGHLDSKDIDYSLDGDILTLDITELDKKWQRKLQATFVSRFQLSEGKWATIMKDVRKAPQPPFSVVAIQGGKVVGQANDIKIADAIPAHYEDMKKKYPGAKISIENGEGLSVFNESLNEGSDQARLTHFKKLGIAPNNQPQNAAYIKQVAKPGKFFVDWKDAFDLGDVALGFVKSDGSISEFDIIDLKTMKRTGKTLDVKKGQLGNLRTTYGVKLRESVNESGIKSFDEFNLTEAASKPAIVIMNGRRLAVQPDDLKRLESGKDVVGMSTKYPGQEEWVLAKSGWKLEESAEFLPSFELLFWMATIMGAADLAQAVKDGEGSIIKDLAELAAKEAGSKLKAAGKNIKALASKLKSNPKLKAAITKADAQISEGLVEKSLILKGDKVKIGKVLRSNDFERNWSSKHGGFIFDIDDEDNGVYASDEIGIALDKAGVKYDFDMVFESLNEFGPLAGSGNTSANAIEDIKRLAAKRSENGKYIYVINGKHGTYKLSRRDAGADTVAAYYNGMPQDLEESLDEMKQDKTGWSRVVDRKSGKIIRDQMSRKLALKLAALKTGWITQLIPEDEIEESLAEAMKRWNKSTVKDVQKWFQFSAPHPKGDGDGIAPRKDVQKRWETILSKKFEAPVDLSKVKNLTKDNELRIVFKHDGEIYRLRKMGENSKSASYSLQLLKKGAKLESVLKEYKTMNIQNFNEYFMNENIQDKADAINAFGRAAKRRNFDELVSMFINNREYEEGSYLDAFNKVLTKYKLTDKFRIALEEFENFTDSAGGRGLASHK